MKTEKEIEEKISEIKAGLDRIGRRGRVYDEYVIFITALEWVLEK